MVWTAVNLDASCHLIQFFESQFSLLFIFIQTLI